MKEYLTTPTFVIGLGGIGQKVTFLLAERFENSRWRVVPPTIRIRSFDTAMMESYKRDDVEIPVSKFRRFTRLGQFDGDQVIQHLHVYPEIQDWWDYQYTIGFIGEGAKSERPVGRLVFFRNLDQIHQVLLDDFKAPLADDLQTQLIKVGLGQVSRHPLVYIVGSLAGGTCSGMLIDMAILVRWLLVKLGYESGSINITALLGLESVINVATQSGNDQIARRRRLNVNAALREIDFLQGGQENFTINYPQPLSRIEPVRPLFNQVYLFTSRRMGGFFYQNQWDILSRVAHFIFGQIASKTGQEARAIMDNVGSYFNPNESTVSGGLKAIYASFGVEWLEVPKKNLLAAWCQKHADLLGNLAVEIDWTREPKENLLRKFKELIPPKLHGYRQSLAILESGPQGILAAPGMGALAPKLEAIQGAQNKTQLMAALHDFESELPPLLTKILRREVALAGDPSFEDAWLLEAIQTLCRDRGFRLGGARRVLQEAARYIRSLTSVSELSLSSVKEVVRQSTGFFGRVRDPGPALEWAKAKTFQTARQILRNEMGLRFDALATKMEECANGLQRLQEKIRDLTRHMRTLQATGDTIPPETYLLNPNDMQTMLDEAPEEVARLGADEIAERVAGELTLTLLRAQDTGFLENNLRYWIESALEKAIETRIQPPRDRVKRICHRMTQCEPMCYFIDRGPEFNEIMRNHHPTDLKIVLTGGDNQDQDDLRKWALEENQKGKGNTYQIFANDEFLRDDILYITCGWPLWLVDEVRSGETLLEQTKKDDIKRYHNSFILGRQIPASREHQIRPLEESDAQTWFGIALALRDIDFGVGEIHFKPAPFPGLIPIEAPALGDCLEKAYQLFRQQGLAHAYKTYVRRELERDRGLFKSRLEEGLAHREAALLGAFEGGQITADEKKRLSTFYRLAREYARRIVIL